MAPRGHLSACLTGLIVTAVAGCGPVETCTEERPLVTPEAWSLLGEIDDPWAGDPGERVPCLGSDLSVEAIGVDDSWSVDTGICNWATAAQPLMDDVAEGDLLEIRVWYFSQTVFRGELAKLGVALGGVVADEWEVPIPTESGVLHEVFASPVDAPAGDPVVFHLGNHGDNTWNLISIERLVEGPCEGEG